MSNMNNIIIQTNEHAAIVLAKIAIALGVSNEEIREKGPDIVLLKAQELIAGLEAIGAGGVSLMSSHRAVHGQPYGYHIVAPNGMGVAFTTDASMASKFVRGDMRLSAIALAPIPSEADASSMAATCHNAPIAVQ